MISAETAYQRCEAITWSEARNFAYGIRLLPPPKRRAMAALYAMARRIDDVGDGDWPQDRKLAALDELHTVIGALEAGDVAHSDDPVLVAVAHAASRYPIPVEALHEIVEGCEHDVRGETYATMDDTVRYCRLVAGSVGRLSLGVFGTTGTRGAVSGGGGSNADPAGPARSVEDLADDLGVALQLTNMLRDIVEDHRMGRIYLPEQERDRFGITPGQWAPPDRVATLVQFVAGQAVMWFERGLLLLDHLDYRSRACTAAMAGIYRRLLGRILAQPALPLNVRVSLPATEKALVVVRSLCGLRPSSRAPRLGRGSRALSGTQPVRVAAVEPRPDRRDRAVVISPAASSERPRVVVVGGGLAGLSAAVEAVDRGAAVILLERRPRLGGATWSFERNGIWFDNGQHVFMRCCTAYRTFLERIGSADGVWMQNRLNVPVMAPGGPVGSIRRTPGPAPLHLAPALLSYPHLSPRQRLAVLRTGLALRRLDPSDPALDTMTFGDWLSAHGQDATAIETFWNLIVVPTVNAGAADASLKLAAKVFVTGLLTDTGAADIGWARVPLSALHGDAARRTLEAAGCEVRPRAGVRAVRTGTAGLEVRTEDQVIEADSVVVAVPHDAVAGLLPPGTVAAQDRLIELGTSPIVNVHLVYDRPVTDLDLFATVGSDAQFVFDRTDGAGLDDGRQCLAVSLSAAESYIGMTSADLVRHFTAELARLLPAAAHATVTESIVTRERSATFLGVPGTDSLRAGARCNLPGVYLAGAWSDTGWPATMEGAVRSGTAAGRLAARYASRLATGSVARSTGAAG